MERRRFVKSTAGLLAGLGSTAGKDASAEDDLDGAARRRAPPNILFILVDQLRFPTVFPAGIETPGEFLRKYMPNLFELWRVGVKFGGHYTAGNACSPARATIITGLYTQQTWVVNTVLTRPDSRFAAQPTLSPAFPTYGRLLRQARYQTPYCGKWHVSLIRNIGLDLFGFDNLLTPDPTGSNLQGTVGNEDEGYLNDRQIARRAIRWLRSPAACQDQPWCLTVSFINPHDKEFFWAGTEFKPYNALFPVNGTYKPFTYYSETINGTTYEPTVNYRENPLKNPRNNYGYPTVPPNWETPSDLVAHNKPSSQTMNQLFQSAVWGGVSYDPAQTGFTIVPYPVSASGTPPKQYGVASAPYSYWQRNLDSYTRIMGIIDQRIGDVLTEFMDLPARVRNNTVVVFTSDHGEYAGAHGYVSGKVGTCYEEAWHVPLIVADFTDRFAGDIGRTRKGLTSSVDLLPLLVGLGHNGSRAWMRNELAALYGNRHDLFPMLRSVRAPGRPYVAFATDESAPGFYNFNKSPFHILCMRTADAKLGIYANWIENTDQIDTANGLELEYYDYSTEAGRLELISDPTSPQAMEMARQLLTEILPYELRAPLPPPLRIPQALTRRQYLAYAQFIANYTPSDDATLSLPRALGFGKEF